MCATTPQRFRCDRGCWRLMLPIALSVLGGCYDGDALLKEAQSTSLSTSLAEVDLGQYITTLPRDPNTGAFSSVDLRVFGTVQRSKLSEVKKQLQADGYRVRHAALAAIRSSSRDELTDPKFAKLRARLEQVVNKELADAPIKQVGFYQLTVR